MNGLFCRTGTFTYTESAGKIFGAYIGLQGYCSAAPTLAVDLSSTDPSIYFCPSAPSCLFLLIQLRCLVHYFNPSLTLSFHLGHVASPSPG